MSESTDEGQEAPVRTNANTPAGFEGWDGMVDFGAGGTPGDAYYVTAPTTYDDPVGLPAWVCTDCGSLVLDHSLDRHRTWHRAARIGFA